MRVRFFDRKWNDVLDCTLCIDLNETFGARFGYESITVWKTLDGMDFNFCSYIAVCCG